MHEDSCAVRGYGGKKLTMTHHIASSKRIRIAGPLTKPFEIEKNLEGLLQQFMHVGDGWN
ncbi:MAG: hypothetical protein OSB82_14860 [Alphaproteobacteria bacterium]|nr:hypothetical protein [Alphaproteobacteria bacterium]